MPAIDVKWKYYLINSSRHLNGKQSVVPNKKHKALLERSTWTETETDFSFQNFKIKAFLNDGGDMNRCIVTPLTTIDGQHKERGVTREPLGN